VSCATSGEPLPGNYPLTLYRGDTRVWQLRFRDDDDEATTSDLTGVTWLAQIRARDDDTVLASMSVDDEHAAEGELVLTLTASATSSLPVGSAQSWDLQATRPDGSVRTYLAGRVRVRGDVSRS
jgi:hypothetical protein